MTRYLIVAIVTLAVGLLLGSQTQSAVASLPGPESLPMVGFGAIPTAVPTPLSAQPMSVYEVDSKEPVNTLTLTHTFKNLDGTVRYVLTDTLPAGATRQYHVGSMAQLPFPWSGTVEITVTNWTLAQPVAVGIAGYDYAVYNCPPITIIKGQ